MIFCEVFDALPLHNSSHKYEEYLSKSGSNSTLVTEKESERTRIIRTSTLYPNSKNNSLKPQGRLTVTPKYQTSDCRLTVTPKY